MPVIRRTSRGVMGAVIWSAQVADDTVHFYWNGPGGDVYLLLGGIGGTLVTIDDLAGLHPVDYPEAFQYLTNWLTRAFGSVEVQP